MTILRRLPLTFTQPSPQKLAPARHSAGVTGFKHRYMSEDIGTAVGSVAGAWEDYVGAKALAAAPNGPTVRALPDGRKYLEFDGVNDFMANNTIPDGDSLTVVMVARSRDTAVTYNAYMAGLNCSIARSGNTATALNPGTAKTVPVPLDNQWRVVVAVATPTVATLTVDGTTGVATAAGTFGTALRLGGANNSSFSMLDIVEFIAFPTALSDPEKVSVRAAMKAAYPTLLL